MDILLLVLLIASSITAVLVRDMLKAALSLAAASIILAIIFFRMGALYAGVFEVSVVAGLITVLFVSTIALTKTEDSVKERNWPVFLFPVFLGLVVLFDVLLMNRIGWLAKIGPNAVPDVNQNLFGQVLWTQRTFDLVGQIAIIMAGVVVVLALFRKEKK
jgi:NADH-quinone oxidoreductase subunit J